MSDLRVDYARLNAAASDLARIAAELADAEATRDANEHIWGPEVDSAMADFVDNWDRHRAELLASVRSVGQMCAATCETFRGVETALEGSLTDRHASPAGTGPAPGPVTR